MDIKGIMHDPLIKSKRSRRKLDEDEKLERQKKTVATMLARLEQRDHGKDVRKTR